MSMFCHQCQETMKNVGCSMKQGMCGKTAEVANLQDLFIWCLKGISFWGNKAKEFDIYNDEAGFFIDKGLFSTITNANFDRDFFINSINESISIREELKNSFLQAHEQKQNQVFSESVPECATWVPGDDSAILAMAESGIGGWLEIEYEDELFSEPIPVAAKVVWVTPKGATSYLPGIGIQLSEDNLELMHRIETQLADQLNSKKPTYTM